MSTPRPNRSSRPRARRVPRGSSGERLVVNHMTAGGFARDPQSSFPDAAVVDLFYYHANDETPGVAYADHIFRINSAYDPDYTLTGHQPRDFDTWALLYGYYRVSEVMADVTIATNNTTPLTAWAISNQSGSSLIDTAYPPELPRARKLGGTSNGAPPITVSFKVDCAAVAGLTKPRYMADDLYGAATSTNPSRSLFLHVYMEEINGSQAVSVQFSIRLRMRVHFYGRIYASPSTAFSALRHAEPPRIAPPPPSSAAAAAATTADRPGTDDGVVVSRTDLARALAAVTARR